MNDVENITKEVIIITAIASSLAVLLLIVTMIWIVRAQNKAERKAQAHDEWKGFVINQEADKKLMLQDDY